MTVKRVLVGWDGSRDARQALRFSCELVQRLDGEVVVVEVVHRGLSPESPDEARRELSAHDRELHAALAVQARDPRSAERLRHGVIAADDVGRALCDYASEHGFDLLVVGRHGVDETVHPKIGRVTEHEVRHCACPVLVVSAS